MAAYDKMSDGERQQLMQVLGSLTGLQEGPKEGFPDGTRYAYDPDLKTTVEVTPSGERFPVTLVAGKLQRKLKKVPAHKTIRYGWIDLGVTKPTTVRIRSTTPLGQPH